MRKTSVAVFLGVVALFLAVSRVESQTDQPEMDNVWNAADVPADDWDGFFLYYQRFLRERLPREVRNTGDKSRDHARRLKNHRELADLTARLSDACNELAHSGAFPDCAAPTIKKEDKNRIPGTWNFYRNVPPNADDLWQESCHLRFLSMLHESEVDFDRLAAINEYAGQAAKLESLQRLYPVMKRAWYAKTLDRVYRFANRESEPCDERLNETNAGTAVLVDAIRDFRPFWKSHFNRENTELAERFVNVAERCRADEKHAEISELLQATLVEAAENATASCRALKADPAAASKKRAEAAELLEWVELLQGVMRRGELPGQPLPIWGRDLTGETFDAGTLDGKIVLLDFWATWCAPCVAEFPQLKILYEKYHERGFEIVGYNVDSDLEQLSAFLERKPLPWPVLVKEKSLEKGEPSLSTYYGAKKLPVVILRDRQGQTILLDARGKALEETLERLFAQ